MVHCLINKTCTLIPKILTVRISLLQLQGELVCVCGMSLYAVFIFVCMCGGQRSMSGALLYHFSLCLSLTLVSTDWLHWQTTSKDLSGSPTLECIDTYKA